MGMTRTSTLGIRVDAIEHSDLPRLVDWFARPTAPALFTFVNPASVILAERDPEYRRLLEEFDAVLPDGIGMCWAVRLVHGLPAARVSFDSTSLAPMVFRHAQRENLTVALVGGRPGVARRAADQLVRAFPTLPIVASLDGYGDHTRKIGELRALRPAVVITGMGALVQERFLLRLVATGWSGCGFTCGGYLDQLVDGMHYYPRWVDAANLRWAYRLIREPRRLSRRYGMEYPYFAARLALSLLS
jgi:N-acetylglucosaminyldiphosphoundecaprenol N-acetyl-beta-D-mannosaminyltransferase